MDAPDERRKYARVKLKGGVYVTLQPGGGRSGPIEDISNGGFAFSYASVGKFANEPLTVDIFTNDGQFQLKNIRCRTVYDATITKPESTNLLQKRRHALEFKDIKPQQEKALKFLLKAYAK